MDDLAQGTEQMRILHSTSSPLESISPSPSPSAPPPNLRPGSNGGGDNEHDNNNTSPSSSPSRSPSPPHPASWLEYDTLIEQQVRSNTSNYPDHSSTSRIPDWFPSSFFPGSQFKGTQISGPDRYTVTVQIMSVDFSVGQVSGTLMIEGLTTVNPVLTTFFEGEIIGPKYSFITDHPDWGATVGVDYANWACLMNGGVGGRGGGFGRRGEEERESSSSNDSSATATSAASPTLNHRTRSCAITSNSNSRSNSHTQFEPHPTEDPATLLIQGDYVIKSIAQTYPHDHQSPHSHSIPLPTRAAMASKYIYMRWKEQFLLPDYHVRTLEGASLDGYYYIQLDISTGRIQGLYQHSSNANTNLRLPDDILIGVGGGRGGMGMGMGTGAGTGTGTAGTGAMAAAANDLAAAAIAMAATDGTGDISPLDPGSLGTRSRVTAESPYHLRASELRIARSRMMPVLLQAYQSLRRSGRGGLEGGIGPTSPPYASSSISTASSHSTTPAAVSRSESSSNLPANPDPDASSSSNPDPNTNTNTNPPLPIRNIYNIVHPPTHPWERTESENNETDARNNDPNYDLRPQIFVLPFQDRLRQEVRREADTRQRRRRMDEDGWGGPDDWPPPPPDLQQQQQQQQQFYPNRYLNRGRGRNLRQTLILEHVTCRGFRPAVGIR